MPVWRFFGVAELAVVKEDGLPARTNQEGTIALAHVDEMELQLPIRLAKQAHREHEEHERDEATHRPSLLGNN